jgi:hypothetical protein
MKPAVQSPTMHASAMALTIAKNSPAILDPFRTSGAARCSQILAAPGSEGAFGLTHRDGTLARARRAGIDVAWALP